MKSILLASVCLLMAGTAAVPTVFASVSNPTSEPLLVQRPQQQPVQLLLTAELKQVKKDSQGKEVIAWSALPNNAQVQPQSIVRYTVTAQNNTNRNMRNLVVSQPVPEGMVYVLDTATKPTTKGGRVEFSIDGGKTFTEKPVIRVRENGRVVEKPAPAEAYTHVRWNFGEILPANSKQLVSYQVRVK